MEFLLELIIDLFISYITLCLKILLAQVVLIRLTIFLVPDLWFHFIMANIKTNNNDRQNSMNQTQRIPRHETRCLIYIVIICP